MFEKTPKQQQQLQTNEFDVIGQMRITLLQDRTLYFINDLYIHSSSYIQIHTKSKYNLVTSSLIMVSKVALSISLHRNSIRLI